MLAIREAAGDAAGFDRLRAEREAFDLDAERALAGTELARAQATLVGLFATAVDPDKVIAVRADQVRQPVPPLATLLARAESTRGELLALAREAEAVEIAARAAARRSVPEPELVVGVKTSTAIGGDVGGVITIQASLPLFDRARPERARAAAQAVEAEARAEAFRLSLRAELAGLRSAVIQHRGALDRYRAATDASGEVEQIARASYDAGERGILELLDAYRTVAEARMRLAALERAAWEAEIELEYASGWETSS